MNEIQPPRDGKGKPSVGPMTASKIRVGATFQDVLDIVGHGNLYEVRSIFASCIPEAKSVMSFDSEPAIPSGWFVGFDEKGIVVKIVRTSMR